MQKTLDLRDDLANRIFFKPYQCANMMRKTGAKAVQDKVVTDTRDRLSRRVVITASGRHVWSDKAQPKIRAYYRHAMSDFSTTDMTHALHYLVKLLENMGQIDPGGSDEESSADE